MPKTTSLISPRGKTCVPVGKEMYHTTEFIVTIGETKNCNEAVERFAMVTY